MTRTPEGLATEIVGKAWTGKYHDMMTGIVEAAALIDAHIAEREAAQTRVNQALIDGCNKMLAKGAQGTMADLEVYVALREAALVERIIAEGGFDGYMVEYLRKAARRKE